MLVGAELRRIAVATIGSTLAIAAALVVTVAPTTTAEAAFSCSSSGLTYTVRAGDGWFAIADRAEVSVGSLLDANDAELTDVLLPGDRLCLPRDANPAADCHTSYVVRRGDSWYAIAARADVPVRSLLNVNHAELNRVLFPGRTVCLPGGATIPSGGSSSATASRSGSASTSGAVSTTAYTVRSGDGWTIIADRVQVGVGALLRVNGARLTDVIVPGQKLKLPAGAKPPPEPDPDRPAWIELEALPTQGPCWFHDTWNDARSGGRKHVGVDIFTVPGEYVYAVADGRLSARYWELPGRRSGNAWFLVSDAGDRYFYAHLAEFAPNLGVGSRVQAGQIIGWVGSTGNSTYPHLHFEIHPGGGEPVNPYPMLKQQGACNRGTPYTQPGGWIPD